MPTWIFYSLLMFLASNGLYLLIRFAQKQGIVLSFYSIFFFLVPSLIYFTSAQALAVPLWVGYERLALILAAGFVWTFVGNFASQKAILLAANPGYSLVIQKSAAVFTTVAAVWLFGAEFVPAKLAAIVGIILFVLLLSVERRRQTEAGAGLNWLWLSLLANLCFTFGQLISKHFLNIGLEPLVYLFYINALVALLNVLQFRLGKHNWRHSAKQWLVVLGIGLLAAAFNLSMQMAFRSAPNLGYVSAINVASIMSITLLSALLFGDELSRRKVLAMLGVMLSLGWLLVG